MNTGSYYCISDSERIEDVVASFVASCLGQEECDALENELKEYLDQEKYYDYVVRCVDTIPQLYSSKKIEEFKCFITVLSDMLNSITVYDLSQDACTGIASQISSLENCTSTQKMELLNIVFNAVQAFSAEKCIVLKFMVSNCKGFEECLYTYILKMDINEWDITVDMFRDLLLSLNTTLLQIEQFEKCRVVLIHYLLTFESASHEELEQTTPYAVQSIVYSLRFNTKVEEYNELEFIAIKYLAKHEEYKSVYQLLHVMRSGDLEKLEQLKEQNKEFLEKNNIDVNSLVTSTRLSLLLSLLNNKTIVEFKDIATALQISENEVERWIIAAYKQKLVEGKINQVNKTFTITRTTCLEFTSDDWNALQNKIRSWKNTIQNAIHSIEQIEGL
ncbi:hypothetical protein WA158_000700 [Blastocystis sp. Blastoise]